MFGGDVAVAGKVGGWVQLDVFMEVDEALQERLGSGGQHARRLGLGELRSISKCSDHGIS